MTPDVVRVKPLPGFCLEAEFATGERRWFDMKPYLGYPAFAPLAENDEWLLQSLGPSLIYDPTSGRLTAQIPAVVMKLAQIEIVDGLMNEPLYVKAYSVSEVRFESSLFLPAEWTCIAAR